MVLPLSSFGGEGWGEEALYLASTLSRGAGVRGSAV